MVTVRTTFRHARHQLEDLLLRLDEHQITDEVDKANDAMPVFCCCMTIYFVWLGVRFQHIEL